MFSARVIVLVSVACTLVVEACGEEGPEPTSAADATSDTDQDAVNEDAGTLDTAGELREPTDVPSGTDAPPPTDVPEPPDDSTTGDGQVADVIGDPEDAGDASIDAVDAQDGILASDAPDGDSLELLEDSDDSEIAEDVSPPEPIGPVAWYRFEATEGPVLDSSGNDLHGTATGWGVARNEPGVNGGLAVAFDGTGGRVIIPENELFELSDGFTMEAWVKPTSITDHHTVLHMGTANGNEISMAILPGDWGLGDGSDVGGRLQASISAPFPSLNNDLTVVKATDASVGPQGGWFHVAVTNDGQYMRLYGNGQILKVGDHGYYMDAMEKEDVRIGGDDYNGTVPNPFIGLVDEVKWWNVARTGDEICGDLGGFSNGAGGCGMPSGQ